MATKHKRPGVQTVKRDPEQPTIVPPDPKFLQLMEQMTRALQEITGLLNVLAAPPTMHRVGPSSEPGGPEEFLAGRFHRRAGDVYKNVAKAGTPNAGDTDEQQTS